jgi:GcrA cell cycle regulator
MPWTELRTNALMALWADGLSASQIADKLGDDVSRNAVIGKVHRLGLTGRAPRQNPNTVKAKKERMARAIKPRIRFLEVGPPLAVVPDPAPMPPWSDKHKIHFMNFVHDHSKCSWPLWGDNAAFKDKFYCGAPTADGHRLCWFHGGIAYQPAPARKRPYWVKGKAA